MTVQELFDSADVKGNIETLPQTKGIAVLKENTIGIYVGNGNAIYAKSAEDGIVKENISAGGWTSWFEIPWIQYGDEKASAMKSNLKNMTKRRKIIWDLFSGRSRLMKTAGDMFTDLRKRFDGVAFTGQSAVFGSEVTSYMDFIRHNWLGKRTADCVGLIKGYGWYNPDSGEIVVGSNGMMDVGANAMFANAAVKGTIDTIPEVPGLAVWSDGHIGIYIGNGEVIEAMNTLRGVTRTKLAGREWTHWLQIPYISYVEEKE